jgi:hypothetical protein
LADILSPCCPSARAVEAECARAFCALLIEQFTRCDSSLRTAPGTCQRKRAEESAFTKIFSPAAKRKRFQAGCSCARTAAGRDFATNAATTAAETLRQRHLHGGNLRARRARKMKALSGKFQGFRSSNRARLRR